MSAEAASVRTSEVVPLPVGLRAAATLRPLLLLVGIAAAVAVGVAVVLWTQEPSYSVLYAGLSTDETAGIIQALEAAGIPHRMESGTGAIAVPTGRLADARLKIAAQGLPQSDSSFAAMSKEQGFGVSEFMENARYQHALEGELARTIASLQSVQGARVHIARPRESAFVHDKRAASASVFLQLKSGRRLASEQVTAIVNLVASSVPELTPEQVTVIDSSGRLLSAPETPGDFATRDKEFEYANRLESGFKDRIEALLAPLVGPGRVRAQVVAQVDMSSSEEAHEQYNPDRTALRSEQTSEETSRNGNTNGGVPGALSNQPPVGGVAVPAPSTVATTPTSTSISTSVKGKAAAAAAAPAAPTPPDNTSKQATRNFEIDRTLAYSRQPAGRLKRLTVAVLIDDLRSTDAKGVVTETALPAEQLERITALVKDAVGFDAARGDSIEVVNASFRGDQLEAPKDFETLPIWERPMVRDIIKILAGLAALALLMLTVLRPLVRNLLHPLQQSVFAAAELADAASAERARLADPNRAAAGAGEEAAAESAGSAAPAAAAIAYEKQLAAARSIVAQDPKRVAQVVKSWVGKDE
jgi:flagellar M-ring protein FliF